jgi:phosphopantetheinyl transferase
MTDVLVLHAALPGGFPTARAGALLPRLPYAHRLELERRDAAARAASLLGLELLLAGTTRLRGTAPDPVQLHFPQHGKPRLDGGPWFSISHTASRVAVALTDRGDLGFDLEDVIAGRFDRAALERWTATEAALKAVGAGLRQARDVRLQPDLSVAHVRGEILHLRPVSVASQCVAHIAMRAPVDRVQVDEVDPG